VSETDQDHRDVTLTIAAALPGRGDQFVDFRRRQVFARPKIFVLQPPGCRDGLTDNPEFACRIRGLFEKLWLAL
jgi:hypothetical protein